MVAREKRFPIDPFWRRPLTMKANAGTRVELRM